MKKTVIVTGSSRGIGQNIACFLAREGHNVILNYNADVEYYDEVSSIYSVLFEYCYDE